jgi:hypothetical protein
MTTYEFRGHLVGHDIFDDSLRQLSANPTNGDRIVLRRMNFDRNDEPENAMKSLIQHMNVVGRSQIHLEFQYCSGVGFFLDTAMKNQVPITSIAITGAHVDGLKYDLHGLEAFINGTDSTIQCLCFNEIKILAPEFFRLRDIVGQATTLEELRLTKINSTCKTALLSLFEQLSKNKRLKRLHIETTHGTPTLTHCPVLKHHRSLESIDIHMLNSFSNDGLYFILRHLRNIPKLQRVSTSLRVHAFDEGWKRLARVLKKPNPALQKLHLALFVDNLVDRDYLNWSDDTCIRRPRHIFDFSKGITTFYYHIKNPTYRVSPKLDFNLVLYDKKTAAGCHVTTCRYYYDLQITLFLCQKIRPVLYSSPKYKTLWPQLVSRINRSDRNKAWAGANVLYTLIRHEALKELLLISCQGILPACNTPGRYQRRCELARQTYCQLRIDLLLRQKICPVLCCSPKYQSIWPQLIASVSTLDSNKAWSGANVLYNLIRHEAFREFLLSRDTSHHATTIKHSVNLSPKDLSIDNKENNDNDNDNNNAKRSGNTNPLPSDSHKRKFDDILLK